MTADQLKIRLGGIDDDVDDVALAGACASASKWIEAYCNRRRFGFNKPVTASALVYQPNHAYRLPVDDISTTTDLVVKVDMGNDGTYETTWTLGTHFQLRPFDSFAASEPASKIETLGGYTFPRAVRPSVEVTATWGWPAVPALVTEACYQLAEETFKLKDAPFGVAGVNDFGVLRIGNQTMNRVQSMLSSLVVGGGVMVA